MPILWPTEPPPSVLPRLTTNTVSLVTLARSIAPVNGTESRGWDAEAIERVEHVDVLARDRLRPAIRLRQVDALERILREIEDGELITGKQCSVGVVRDDDAHAAGCRGSQRERQRREYECGANGTHHSSSSAHGDKRRNALASDRAQIANTERNQSHCVDASLVRWRAVTLCCVRGIPAGVAGVRRDYGRSAAAAARASSASARPRARASGGRSAARSGPRTPR